MSKDIFPSGKAIAHLGNLGLCPKARCTFECPVYQRLLGDWSDPSITRSLIIKSLTFAVAATMSFNGYFGYREGGGLCSVLLPGHQLMWW